MMPEAVASAVLAMKYISPINLQKYENVVTVYRVMNLSIRSPASAQIKAIFLLCKLIPTTTTTTTTSHMIVEFRKAQMSVIREYLASFRSFGFV